MPGIEGRTVQSVYPGHRLTGVTGMFCLGCCFVFAISAACADTAATGDLISRHVRYSFILRNTTNRVIEQAALWTYAPVKRTGIQQRTALSASHPFELLTDSAGNQILHFAFAPLPPYVVKRVTIDADLLLTDVPQQGAGEQMSARSLQPEPYCESDDPDIQRLAGQLRRADVMSTVEQIFQWVVTHVSYSGYLKHPRGARYALTYRQGDCTEFMYLFMALCRAAGIPARGVGGYVITRNRHLNPVAYHNWAEFYHHGVWYLADPQRNILMEQQSHYLVMRLIQAGSAHPTESFRRFRASGEGLEVTMN